MYAMWHKVRSADDYMLHYAGLATCVSAISCMNGRRGSVWFVAYIFRSSLHVPERTLIHRHTDAHPQALE
jgi:hypothetical protein